MIRLDLPVVSPSSRGDEARLILKRTALAITLAIACTWVYFVIFSKFAPWDDEGYLMFEVRCFLEGHRLYNDVYAQYGPFYFLVQWIYYGIVGQPVTHDLVRFFAGSQWLGSATLLAWTVQRVTRSWILTGFAYFAILKTLSIFAEGAGHPQSICLVLVACLLALSCTVEKTVDVWRAAAFAFLATALALTKINAGFYLGTALLLAMLKTSPVTAGKRWIFWLTGLAGMIVIWIIMAPLFQFAWDRNLCLVITLSISAVLMVGSATALRTSADLRSWASFLLAFGAAAILILLPFLFQGTTLTAFLWMTVLQHKDFARNWYFRLPSSVIFSIYAFASLGCASLWLWSRKSEAFQEKFSRFLQLCKGLVGLVALVWASVENPYALAVMPFKILLPVIWMVLVPARQEEGQNMSFGRLMLALVAAYLAMYPFPVAGAQVNFSVSITLVVAVIFVYDFWIVLRSSLAPEFWQLPIQKIASASLLLLIAGLYLGTLATVFRTYRNLDPLGLPGADRVRFPERDAQTYKWLVKEINTHCDTFVAMPGIFSLYFWVKPRPASLRASHNCMNLMDPRQQQALVNDLSTFPRACVVYSPSLLEFWRRGQDQSRLPLERYIRDRFVAVEERYGYYFLLPKKH